MARILAVGIAALDVISVVDGYPQEDSEVRRVNIYAVETHGENHQQLTSAGSEYVGSEIYTRMYYPRLSPDGRYLSLEIDDKDESRSRIYLMDLASGTIRHLSINQVNPTYPSWSPDGNGLVFTSKSSGKRGIYAVRIWDRQVRAIVPRWETLPSANY